MNEPFFRNRHVLGSKSVARVSFGRSGPIAAVWFAILLATLSNTVAQTEAELANQISAAFQARNFDKIVQLTEGVAPGTPLAQVRGTAFQERGIQHFFDAEIDESIADFDAYLALRPENDAHHWQRGLCYYYAGRFEDGVAQFERHQTVNSQDVENAVWHFLCAVRAPDGDVEEARKEFINIDQDSRVPMAEIHKLFAGTGTPGDVLAAAEAPATSERYLRNQRCYAYLYLGLYYEALGHSDKAKEHMVKAATDYRMDHYMGRVAQVHAKLRGWLTEVE